LLAIKDRGGWHGGMKYNDFDIDLKYSLEARENELFDTFYYRVFSNLRDIELVMDKERQRKGIDKILYFNNGKQVSIDEKKRRKDYGDILLELWSVWEEKKKGWLLTAQCDYIVYAVMPSKKVYLLPTLLLGKAWEKNKGTWVEKAKDKNNGFYIVKALNKRYSTISIAIPTEILLSSITEEMKQDLRE